MGDAIQPNFKTIFKTPLRDLLRGRITGRRDWKRAIAAADLPAELTQLILRIVRRTRLTAIEKNSVAEELIAHFHDGIAAGITPEELVNTFGDPALAAKLIRRAKRRNRPLILRIISIIGHVVVAPLVIYLALFLRVYFGRPTISVDYVAKMNEEANKIPESDRAWPLWEAAIAELNTVEDPARTKFLSDRARGIIDPEQMKLYLHEHRKAFELAALASQKPAMGLVTDPNGLQRIQSMLCYYLEDRVDANDAEGFLKGICSLVGLQRQISTYTDYGSAGSLSPYAFNDAVVSSSRAIKNNASLFSNAQLISLAHLLAVPEHASDFINLASERASFYDDVQHQYTDDGNGDGHLTIDGYREILERSMQPGEKVSASVLLTAARVPLISLSRQELVKLFDRLINQTEANLRRPIRTVDDLSFNEPSKYSEPNLFNGTHWFLIVQRLRDVTWEQADTERILGNRDGTLVAISLELYRRHNGWYPSNLAELVPIYLPSIPANRFTGEPIKFRLSDGKLKIYADGSGTRANPRYPTNSPLGKLSEQTTCYTEQTGDHAGQWVLYPWLFDWQDRKSP